MTFFRFLKLFLWCSSSTLVNQQRRDSRRCTTVQESSNRETPDRLKHRSVDEFAVVRGVFFVFSVLAMRVDQLMAGLIKFVHDADASLKFNVATQKMFDEKFGERLIETGNTRTHPTCATP